MMAASPGTADPMEYPRSNPLSGPIAVDPTQGATTSTPASFATCEDFAFMS